MPEVIGRLGRQFDQVETLFIRRVGPYSFQAGMNGWEDGIDLPDLAFELEVVGCPERVAFAHLGKRSRRYDSAPVDDEGAIATSVDFVEDVTGEDHRHAAPHAIDEVADRTDLVGIQSDGWFIHDHHLRLCQKCVGDADTLAESFGEFANLPAGGFVSEVAKIHDLIDPMSDLPHGNPFYAGAELQVFLHKNGLGKRVVFWHVSDAGLDFIGETGDGQARNEGRTRSSGKEAGNDAHEGAFARTIWAKQSNHFTFADDERDLR